MWMSSSVHLLLSAVISVQNYQRHPSSGSITYLECPTLPGAFHTFCALLQSFLHFLRSWTER